MPIVEQACIAAIETELIDANFKLDKAPDTKKFIKILASNILKEVKKGTVNVTVTGASASGGPVSGTGIGTIS